MNWDDLQILLAIARGGSRAQAARLLRVDASTVSRRLAVLQGDLGVTLVDRAEGGRMVLTQAGRRAVALAEEMEDRARAIRAGAQERVTRDWVRVTAVPLLVNHILLPGVRGFTQAHPGVGLELIAEARDLSLLHHEAEIALRLARPRDGGQGVLARQIGTLTYSAYEAADATPGLPWIGYDRAMQHLSHAAAVSQAATRGEGAPLAVNDAETLFQAVLAGHGRSLFPDLVAGAHPGLRRVEAGVALPTRPLWLLVRRDVRNLDRVARVVDWLDGLFSRCRAAGSDAGAAGPDPS